jgi:hypothetical protein
LTPHAPSRRWTPALPGASDLPLKATGRHRWLYVGWEWGPKVGWAIFFRLFDNFIIQFFLQSCLAYIFIDIQNKNLKPRILKNFEHRKKFEAFVLVFA